MIYNTPFSALVRAPCSGSVDFAGIFRSYGQMVILNCGQHYRFILAGLSNLSVNTGQKLLKGTQIGHMGTTNTTHDFYYSYATDNKSLTLLTSYKRSLFLTRFF